MVEPSAQWSTAADSGWAEEMEHKTSGAKEDVAVPIVNKEEKAE